MAPVATTLVFSYKTHQSASVRVGGLFGWTVMPATVFYQPACTRVGKDKGQTFFLFFLASTVLVLVQEAQGLESSYGTVI